MKDKKSSYKNFAKLRKKLFVGKIWKLSLAGKKRESEHSVIVFQGVMGLAEMDRENFLLRDDERKRCREHKMWWIKYLNGLDLMLAQKILEFISNGLWFLKKYYNIRLEETLNITTK